MDNERVMLADKARKTLEWDQSPVASRMFVKARHYGRWRSVMLVSLGVGDVQRF